MKVQEYPSLIEKPIVSFLCPCQTTNILQCDILRGHLSGIVPLGIGWRADVIMSVWAFDNCGTIPRWGTPTQIILDSSSRSYNEISYTKYLIFLVKLYSAISRTKRYWSFTCPLKCPWALHELQQVIMKTLTLKDHSLGENWKSSKLILPSPEKGPSGCINLTSCGDC